MVFSRRDFHCEGMMILLPNTNTELLVYFEASCNNDIFILNKLTYMLLQNRYLLLTHKMDYW